MMALAPITGQADRARPGVRCLSTRARRGPIAYSMRSREMHDVASPLGLMRLRATDRSGELPRLGGRHGRSGPGEGIAFRAAWGLGEKASIFRPACT